MDAFSSLALGAAWPGVPGDCGADTALAPLQAPPCDPRAGVGSQTPEGGCGVRLSQLRSLWAASPEQGFLLLAVIFRHFVVAAQTRSLAGAAVCSLGPFQGAAVKMPAERERGSLCSRPAHA